MATVPLLGFVLKLSSAVSQSDVVYFAAAQECYVLLLTCNTHSFQDVVSLSRDAPMFCDRVRLCHIGWGDAGAVQLGECPSSRDFYPE